MSSLLRDAADRGTLELGPSPDEGLSRGEIALAYVRRGWYVFPAKPNGSPLTHHGWHDATIQSAVVERMWRDYPAANPAIACLPSGLIVADFDPRHGGMDSMHRLQKEHGSAWCDTYSVRTRSGGLHFYFRRPQGVDFGTRLGKVAPGVDIIVNGYVIAAGSQDEEGRRYTVERDLAIAPVSAWLLQRLLELQHERERSVAEHNGHIPDGHRNDSLASLAGFMRRQGHDEPAVRGALLAVNTAACVPPLQTEEVADIAHGITTRYPKGARSPGWPVLKEEALYGLAGDVVRALEPHTEADRAGLLVTFLVMFGSAMGRAAHTLVGQARHTGNLFMAQVGETSRGRKGTATTEVRHVFSLVDPEWQMDHVATGLSSGEGLLSAMRDPSGGNEGVTDKRLLIIEPEFATVLKRVQRETNVLSSTLRDAWDRGDLQTMTRHDPIKVTGAHVSLIAHITVRELQRTLTETEQTNGFANRILFVCSRRSKRLPNGGISPNLQRVLPRLRASLDTARGEAEPLRRDRGADALWAQWYCALPDEADDLLGAVTARAEAQALRLSLLYAVLDESDAIRREHVSAALALWDYCEASARYIFGDATGDGLADRILSALTSAGQLSKDEIRNMLHRNVSAGRIDAALEQLEHGGQASKREEQSGGRPRTIYFALSAFSRPIAYFEDSGQGVGTQAGNIVAFSASPGRLAGDAETRENAESSSCPDCGGPLTELPSGGPVCDGCEQIWPAQS